MHFWFTVVPIESVDEGTDRWAIEQGYVSMTPLRLDLTDEKALDRRAALPAGQDCVLVRQAPYRL
jgi:5'-nucleotidase